MKKICFFIFLLACSVVFAEYPSIPENTPDSVICEYEGSLAFNLGDGWYSSGELVFSGPSLYASTVEAAQVCADNFASFLDSYDWPFWGVPDILPWREPIIVHCYSVYDGHVVGDFYRVFFQSYMGSGVSQYDGHYGQCLGDYSQGSGGTGGYGVIQLYRDIKYGTLATGVLASSSLNGSVLASDADSKTLEFTTNTKSINFTQSTPYSVSSSSVVGESDVETSATAEENGTTVNITNNTEINTTLELGDAPAFSIYKTPRTEEEKTVSSFEDDFYESGGEPVYVYILKDTSEYANSFFPYKIDWEKLWNDVQAGVDSIFPVFSFINECNYMSMSGYLPSASYDICTDFFPDSVYHLTINYNLLATHPAIQLFRSILKACIWIGCFMSCLWIWNV